MTTNDRLERRLPAMLDDYAVPRTPAYFDDIIRTTARTRQRPGWSFPERWFPMSAITERMATGPRVPWRMVAVAALLVLVAVAAAALIAASRQPRVPAPFGPAGNGLVAFVDDSGAIVATDPTTGDSRVLVAGPGNQEPMFSPDGTKLAYVNPGTGVLVANADGSRPFGVSDTPLDILSWMPDSRSLVASVGGDLFTLDAARLAEPRPLLASVAVGGDGYNLREASLFRPPDGREILVVENGADGMGLYAHATDGSAVRTVLAASTSPVAFDRPDRPQWSPDGSRIAVVLLPEFGTDVGGRVHVLAADGTGLRQASSLALSDDFRVSEGHPSWSPDGTRIAFQRWIEYPGGDYRPQALTVVDAADGEEREVGRVEVNGYHSWGWSPDGLSIIEVPQAPSEDAGHVLVIDAATGRIRDAGASNAAATWQRVLP